MSTVTISAFAPVQRQSIVVAIRTGKLDVVHANGMVVVSLDLKCGFHDIPEPYYLRCNQDGDDLAIELLELCSDDEGLNGIITLFYVSLGLPAKGILLPQKTRPEGNVQMLPTVGSVLRWRVPTAPWA
jgi:hypothetical protein